MMGRIEDFIDYLSDRIWGRLVIVLGIVIYGAGMITGFMLLVIAWFGPGQLVASIILAFILSAIATIVLVFLLIALSTLVEWIICG